MIESDAHVRDRELEEVRASDTERDEAGTHDTEQGGAHMCVVVRHIQKVHEHDKETRGEWVCSRARGRVGMIESERSASAGRLERAVGACACAWGRGRRRVRVVEMQEACVCVYVIKGEEMHASDRRRGGMCA